MKKITRIKMIVAVLLFFTIQQSSSNNYKCELEADIDSTRIEHGHGWSKIHVKISARHNAPLSHRDDRANGSGKYSIEYEGEDGRNYSAYGDFGKVFDTHRATIKSSIPMQLNYYVKPKRILDEMITNTQCNYDRPPGR